MILRLSGVDTATSAGHDIEVTADPDSTVASLLAALPVRVGGRPCYLGPTPLDPAGTLATSPVVSGATITVGAPGPDLRELPAGAVGALRVVAGPDAGLVTWLSPGTHLLGRSLDAAVPLHDADVSRRHAALEVTAWGAATVSDLGSTNGIFVDGVRLPVAERRAASGRLVDDRTGPGGQLSAQSIVEVGGDVLQWVPLPPVGLRTERSTDGHLDFDRAFAPAPAVPRTEVTLPVDPEISRNIAALLISAVVPIGLGLVMALVLKQPQMLLFCLLGPVTMMGTQLTERRSRKGKKQKFAAEKDAAAEKIRSAVLTEEGLRRTLAPDQVDLVLAATGTARGLWPRNADSPDGLVLRVGTTDERPSITLQGDPWPEFEQPVLRNVPVTVDLRTTGVLGVVGAPAAADRLARWLLVQLGTLRSPEDLRLVVITSTDDAELAWTSWLPHLDAGEAGHVPCRIGNTAATRTARVDELRDLVAGRTAERRTAGEVRFGEDVVVVLHGALALRHVPGMREVLRDGPSVGVYVICVDRQGMNECRGLCEIDESALLLTRSRDDHPREVRPEGIDRGVAERLARCLTPMRDRLTLAGAEAAIPYPVRFLDLVGMGMPAPEQVLAHWAEQPGLTTEVPLGADGSGPVSVDLARQGPHTMLAGATGTGKSILLQTLVTSLLLANRPDELNLVLVDFKGGSAFLPFARCPHVVSLIRSTGETPADVFDQAAAARVLASVRAEVRRRESLLAHYGGEIDEYWKDRARRPSLPALPRLVMIFDEFARVLEVSPDFLKELVNVAAKGRSLGMHLVLATQSLQGKLSAELKNNIDLRITLRQNEPADSTEVLGVPDAVNIPGRLRGRGMILCTKDEIRTPQIFQSGYLGNPPPVDGAPPARVRIVGWGAIGDPRPEERGGGGDQPTDQDLILAAIEAASARLGLAAPFRPLLPPMPAELALEDLEAHATAPVTGGAVPFGLLDDPDAQAQPVAALDLAGTDRLLVGGGPQSGRTTVARSLVTSVATRFRPDQVHLYVIEQQPSGLADYANLPHCGGVFSPAEPDRVRRLVTWLDAEVQRRKMARFGPGGGADPWILLVVDGWEYLENRSDPMFVETSVLSMLRGVITAGPTVGVHVVALGGADMMNGKLPGLYSRRMLLPFPKEEVRRGHLASGMVSPPVLPGRGIDAGSGAHVHVCRPVASPAELVAAAGRPAGLLPPVPVAAGLGVPRHDPAARSPAVADLDPDRRRRARGRRRRPRPVRRGTRWRARVRPVRIGSLDRRSNRCQGTAPGRRRRARPRDPPLAPARDAAHRRGIRVVTGTTVKDADLRDTVTAFDEVRALVDDCEQITVVPSEEGFMEAPLLLQDIAGPGALGRQALVLVGDAQPIVSGQRRSLMRVVTEVMTAGTRILLTPMSNPVARELGFTLEGDQFFAGPPGRGYLTAGRALHLIHFGQS